MKAIIIDLSGKVDNYDKALFESLRNETAIQNVQLLIPGKGLLRLVPKKFSQTEFIVKRFVKVIEGLLNYTIVGLRLLFSKNDIVHFQWLPFMEVVGIEKYILNLFHKISPETKYVLTLHNIYPHGVKNMSNEGHVKYKRRFISTCKQIDSIIVHTLSSKEEVINEFGIKESKISIVHHGVFAPQGIIPVNKNVTDGKVTILQFGLQTYYKGTDVFVDAVNLLPKSYQEMIEARIVGFIGESYFEELKRKDKASLIHWKPYFLPDNELYEEINNSTILLLPYRAISQSGVLLLSIFFEKLIVCSDIPSFVETMHDNDNTSLDKDLFFKNEDPRSLSELLIRYLDKDIDEFSIHKRIKKLKDLYSWKNAACATLEVYKAL